MKCGGRRLVALVLGLSVAIGGGSGCVSVTHVNQPLAQYDPDAGYRPRHPQQRRAPGRTILFLAFSGGGTRAAALAYGVMEELRGTEVRVDGKRVSLLSEIDSISGVSGGTFPASYYALFGDRIFDDFERRFLKKNVQRALFLRMLPPWTLLKLMTPFLDRSDIAARYYDRHIFDGATFSDLRVATGPRVYINATDLTSGERFTFTQDTFDLICSDGLSRAGDASELRRPLQLPAATVDRSCAPQPQSAGPSQAWTRGLSGDAGSGSEAVSAPRRRQCRGQPGPALGSRFHHRCGWPPERSPHHRASGSRSDGDYFGQRRDRLRPDDRPFQCRSLARLAAQYGGGLANPSGELRNVAADRGAAASLGAGAFQREPDRPDSFRLARVQRSCRR
ncbi:MAG: patatin-like phospholipase family protein [Deltaproteobacteria bacterium]|nr:patatin-like phospholipase family protein [Deltaproteobacteria bacterium]